MANDHIRFVFVTTFGSRAPNRRPVIMVMIKVTDVVLYMIAIKNDIIILIMVVLHWILNFW